MPRPVPPKPLSSQVSAAVDRLGVTETARLLGLRIDTTARLAAGDRVNVGTIALASQNLHRLSEREGGGQ